MLINRIKTNLYRCERVKFHTGINEIKDDDWNGTKDYTDKEGRKHKGKVAIKNNQSVIDQLNNGSMTIVNGQDEENDSTQELHEMNVKSATTFLKETFDKETLLKFREKEIENKNRGSIINIIDAQIKSLTDHHDKKDEKKD